MCSMFARLLDSRLSMQMTRCPCASRNSQRWEPRNPAPPVMTAVAIGRTVPVDPAAQADPYERFTAEKALLAPDGLANLTTCDQAVEPPTIRAQAEARPRRVLASTIVGRDSELAAVERFLERVALDSAALVIEGEAGIGKTTLWLEAIAAGEARSFRLLRAQPAETEAKLSYGALADLVGGAFEETRAALPAPQERALAGALLLADVDEPAEMR